MESASGRASPAPLRRHEPAGRSLLPSFEMQACSGCGMATAEPGRFCPACGAVLVDPAGETYGAPPVAAEPGAPGAIPAGSLVGRAIGDFVIDGVIGGGSFGTVYRGRQLGLDRAVAIKVPTYEIAADPVAARRFAREARAAARVVHPGVVAIYAVGELDDGRPYLAMQLIDGEPLHRLVEAGPVPVALRIVRDIASALSETHAAGVIHRDLKPSNVMWRRDRNGDDRITLVDFGIAVCRPGNADATRLTTGGLIGTPHYMSPELAQGEQVDARADLYSLGCLLFELITGTTPFDGSGFEVLIAHLGRPAPRASERLAVPEPVDRLIEALMQKKPDDRPASADAVVAMLDEAIADAVDGTINGTVGGAVDGASTRLSDPRSSRSRRVPRSTPHSAPRSAPHSAPHSAPGPGSVAAAPDGSGRRRTGARRGIAVAAVAALGLSGAGFAGYRLRGGGDGRLDEPEPSETPAGQRVSASGEPLRLIVRDDGELIVRALVPEVVHAGAQVPTHLEIKTKLGSPLTAREVVVTVEDPHHNATAQTAAMHGDQAGHYMFRHRFAEPGAYVVRMFPSETESVTTLDLDVVP
jgi:serine/threonine protein kinase